MAFFIEGIKLAVNLLLSFNPEAYKAIFLSLKVSIISTLIAGIFGIPLGFLIGIKDFSGKRIITIAFNTLYSLPTVIVGLFVYGMLSSSGPLGSLNLLYTPKAMIIGQSILIFPLVTALTIASAKAIDRRVIKTSLTLGADFFKACSTTFIEYKSSFIATVLAGFGRAFGEVGVSMMLGGNIRGYTRNITTTIALETGKGELGLGIAMGLVLLLVACLINIFLQLLQRNG